MSTFGLILHNKFGIWDVLSDDCRSDIASKADRKFEKKVQFYSKVRDSVASLSATKGITKVSFFICSAYIFAFPYEINEHYTFVGLRHLFDDNNYHIEI